MTVAINLALLLLGTAGALAAFGGETWTKGPQPLFSRVTRRGWVSLLCMTATLTLGAIKETRTNAAMKRASTRQNSLEDTLAKATSDLQSTRAKLAAVEPDILQAMLIATQGLRRESDFSTPTLTGEAAQRAVSGRTNEPLVLYGGDFVDYHVFCPESGRRVAGRSPSPFPFPNLEPPLPAPAPPRLSLQIGDTGYPLKESGRAMIIGPIGRPLSVLVLNSQGLVGCELKLLIDSADRTREAARVEPLIRMIEDARAGR